MDYTEIYENLELKKPEEINLGEFVDETQQSSSTEGETELVWWLPTEYFMTSWIQEESIDEEKLQPFIPIIDEYTIVGVAKGEMDSNFGYVNYLGEEELNQIMSLIDLQGEEHSPVDKEEVPEELLNLIQGLKPILANLLGNLGQNMNIIIFPRYNPKQQQEGRVIDASGYGELTIQLGDKEYEWYLPVSALFYPQDCPDCGRELPGTYLYCPWDGIELN